MLIERIEGIRCKVGEGPSWDSSTGALLLVDIVGHRVIRVSGDGAHDAWAMPEQVGAACPMSDGRIAVGLASGFAVLDPATGHLSAVTPHGGSSSAVICEGKVDRQGRFVAMTADSGFRDPIGAIVRWEADGSVTHLDEGYVLGNGPCWTRDGGRFFAADSIRGIVYEYAYDAAGQGGLDSRREFISFAGRKEFPDGAVVDDEDHLWIVMHGSPFILRFDPDGREVGRIEMPTPNVTSLAFGGDDLDVLFVTSLDPTMVPVDVDAAALRAEGGLLYRVSGCGARGIAERPVGAFADPLPADAAGQVARVGA